MRRTKQSYAMRAVALLVGMLFSLWSVGTVSGQEHHDDHGGGGHEPHDTTPTTGPNPTDPPDDPGHPDNWVGTPGQQTTELSYGPFNIPGVPAGVDHTHTGNQFRFGVQKPCNNCYITGIQASMSYTDGTPANPSTGNMLHHMVLANTDWDKTDATCELGIPFPLGLLFGDRFFASGDERTHIAFPPNYGYRVGTGAWNLIYELATMIPEAKSVNIDMTYTWVPNTTPNMREIRPVWMDIAQCGFSTYSVPAGQATNQWSWTANAAGGVMSIGGHQHNDGVNIETINETTGETLWNSVAGYGETPEWVGHHGPELSSMSSYIAPSGAEHRGMVNVGDRITIRSHYDSEAAHNDVMGIVMMFLGEPTSGGGGGTTPTTQPGGGGGTGACETATNSAHVTAGRATSWLIFAWAEGSNNYLGSTFTTTSLQEGPTGTWTRVDSC
jgi:hypothetical protein